MYLKSFNDGSEIRLANQADWLEYFYTNIGLYPGSVFTIICFRLVAAITSIKTVSISYHSCGDDVIAMFCG